MFLINIVWECGSSFLNQSMTGEAPSTDPGGVPVELFLGEFLFTFRRALMFVFLEAFILMLLGVFMAFCLYSAGGCWSSVGCCSCSVGVCL